MVGDEKHGIKLYHFLKGTTYDGCLDPDLLLVSFPYFFFWID